MKCLLQIVTGKERASNIFVKQLGNLADSVPGVERGSQPLTRHFHPQQYYSNTNQ